MKGERGASAEKAQAEREGAAGVAVAEPLENRGLAKKMAFQQAQIPVQKTEEFEQLKSAIERVFAAEKIERLLKQVESDDLHIRQFEKLLDKAALERVDSALARSGRTARELYQALALSDRALIREFYLEKIEQVDPALRERFQKVYRYY